VNIPLVPTLDFFQKLVVLWPNISKIINSSNPTTPLIFNFRHFVTRGTLNAHLKTHSQEAVYQCSFCPITLTTKGSVRRHMTSCHKRERPFICPLCQKTFKSSVLCKKHMKIHIKDVVQKPETTAEAENNALTTIEAGDVARSMPTTIDLGNNAATFFTADSSGTVTIPTFGSQITLNQVILKSFFY
jgi:uncharacterized Zn-finger protein